MPTRPTREPAMDEDALRSLFERSGYVRRRDPERAARLGARYHKGYEVRLVLREGEEIDPVRRGLIRLGLRPGRPFRKHSRIVLPVYGREAVERFSPGTVDGGDGARGRGTARPTRRPRGSRPPDEVREHLLARLAARWRGVRVGPREAAERRRDIEEAVRAGVAAADVARALGLSRQRVSQILLEGTGERRGRG